MDWSMPGLPVHHQLPELAQTHAHRVGDAIQPSHPLSSPSPPAFNLSQHQGLFQWVSSLYQVAKVLELQLQHQSFQWIFRTDFLRIDWFDLLAVQGTLKSLLQHHSAKASILRRLAFFIVYLSHPYMTTGKTSSDSPQHSHSIQNTVVIRYRIHTVYRLQSWFAAVFITCLKHIHSLLFGPSLPGFSASVPCDLTTKQVNPRFHNCFWGGSKRWQWSWTKSVSYFKIFRQKEDLPFLSSFLFPPFPSSSSSASPPHPCHSSCFKKESESLVG